MKKQTVIVNLVPKESPNKKGEHSHHQLLNSIHEEWSKLDDILAKGLKAEKTKKDQNLD